MNRKARIEIEVLVVLITIVLTSAVILFLVKSGTIEVRDDVTTQPVLNAEFLPVGKQGFLAIKDIQFCSSVDEDLNCVEERADFSPAEKVYVRFVVESSVSNGEVLLLRNYRILNPVGEVVLQAEQRNSYNLELNSERETENIIFADFFQMGDDAIPGEYVLDVIMANPLLDRTVTLSKKFEIGTE